MKARHRFQRHCFFQHAFSKPIGLSKLVLKLIATANGDSAMLIRAIECLISVSFPYRSLTVYQSLLQKYSIQPLLHVLYQFFVGSECQSYEHQFLPLQLHLQVTPSLSTMDLCMDHYQVSSNVAVIAFRSSLMLNLHQQLLTVTVAVAAIKKVIAATIELIVVIIRFAVGEPFVVRCIVGLPRLNLPSWKI